MQVISIKQHPKEELIERLRQVTLLNKPRVKPYAEAQIMVGQHHPAFALPTQKYVLHKQLLKIKELQEIVLNKFGKALALYEGYTTIETEEGKFDFLPIITQGFKIGALNSASRIEVSTHPIINDGMHRTYVARLSYLPLMATVYIADPLTEYYAYPNLYGWTDVKVITNLKQKPALNKWYRLVDEKSLYVDFNSAFENQVGAPRGDKNEKN